MQWISLPCQRIPSVFFFASVYFMQFVLKCIRTDVNIFTFFLFFLSFSTGVFLLFLYTVYMSYPLFQLLVVLCLIPFVHYHPVGLCRLCNRLQCTHKVVWRDCRLSISLWKGSFELWMPQRMYSTQIANARTKIHFFENY